AYPRRARRLLVSTPTVKGQSLIEREYLLSDQRQWHVRCIHCNELQRLAPESVRILGGDHDAEGAAAYFACTACAGVF
ncbi:phage terminase large subunit family protein, partial [Citrobacter sp. AAK_AS5]